MTPRHPQHANHPAPETRTVFWSTHHHESHHGKLQTTEKWHSATFVHAQGHWEPVGGHNPGLWQGQLVAYLDHGWHTTAVVLPTTNPRDGEDRPYNLLDHPLAGPHQWPDAPHPREGAHIRDEDHEGHVYEFHAGHATNEHDVGSSRGDQLTLVADVSPKPTASAPVPVEDLALRSLLQDGFSGSGQQEGASEAELSVTLGPDPAD